jgi:hypothetical protein
MGEPMFEKWLNLLADYRRQLDRLRAAWGGVYSLPETPFFLFGMGARRKLVYRGGDLRDAASGELVRRWDVRRETIVPPAYAVRLETAAGAVAAIYEDEEALWLVEGGNKTALSAAPLRLPAFAEHPYGLVLRVLHQEVLVNIHNGLPVPNFLVYPRPWYRDGAMMAMVLRQTGNLDLIRDWVLGLDDPYDHNNGNPEPDNLGQALFLLSLFAGAHSPLAARVLADVERCRQGDHISGITDGAPHPVYQTQWLKLGLRALGLPDPFRLPELADDYAALCWWGEQGADSAPAATSADYPYLTWAADITRGTRLGIVGDRDYPLTWEANASQARYAGMEIVSPEYARRRLAAPHTWHAAEMFFRLMAENE